MRRYGPPSPRSGPSGLVSSLLNRPGILWSGVALATLLFVLVQWPRGGGQAVNGGPRKAGPLDATAAPAAAVPAANASGAAGKVAAAGGAPEPGQPPADKVTLELFVMSRCPDANHCEHVFDKILEKAHPIAHVVPR
jgi:hypothetical protein